MQSKIPQSGRSERLFWGRILRKNKGYLVVIAKYKNMDEIEEYIDLVPILQNLYYDVDEFLTPVKEVQIDYAA